jgi:hypothetical protein
LILRLVRRDLVSNPAEALARLKKKAESSA